MSDLAVSEHLVHTENEAAATDPIQIRPQPEALVGGEPTVFVWALTLAAGISGLLFGYE